MCFTEIIFFAKSQLNKHSAWKETAQGNITQGQKKRKHKIKNKNKNKNKNHSSKIRRIGNSYVMSMTQSVKKIKIQRRQRMKVTMHL